MNIGLIFHLGEILIFFFFLIFPCFWHSDTTHQMHTLQENKHDNIWKITLAFGDLCFCFPVRPIGLFNQIKSVLKNI